MISLLEINKGDMQISSMIALNILVVRALLPVKLIPNIIFYRDKFYTINNNNRDRNEISKNKLSFKDLKPIKNIKLNNVSYLHYNASIPLFNQFSINFAQGTTTVISGENESGKSTLFNIICGALEPMHGTIQINGIEIDRSQKEKAAKLLLSVAPEVKNISSALAPIMLLMCCFDFCISASECQPTTCPLECGFPKLSNQKGFIASKTAVSTGVVA